ncbi:MAG: 3-dehydroquinate synthase [Treponema sp.]|jgi:3-dehydroquinate synthase|nr:3-dehydroquinate synthase [Treponema sp.]
MKYEYMFTLSGVISHVCIQDEVPSIDTLIEDQNRRSLLVCDVNTERFACAVAGNTGAALCVLGAGEAAKNWASIETILRAARSAGLGRDGLLIGIGGGVISDMTAFAASVYMRGVAVALVSTTLLGMVDAAVGGKTGFDLFDIKNLVGTFYPASRVYMPVSSLASLPAREWKSGMAELIKTAILDTEDKNGEFLGLLASLGPTRTTEASDTLVECIARAVRIKGRIVEADPKETGAERIMLNLGHTFAHALESSVGLGQLSHGEAVAWGIARACDLGLALGITPSERAAAILALLRSFDYELAAPYPLGNITLFMNALSSDKKKKAGTLNFVVPSTVGTELVSGKRIEPALLARIVGVS